MFVAALLATASIATPLPPRNIVVILADDMGLASLHAAHPDSGLPTPHLDALRSQGMSFTDAHSPSAVCSPTRYGLLTGRYAWRTHMKHGIVPKWGPPLIDRDRKTLADIASEAGLHTACIGKWHLGWRWPATGGGTTRVGADVDWQATIGGGPLEAGFDYYFGDDVPNWPPYVWIENDRALGIPSVIMEEDDANGVRRGLAMEDWSLEAVLPELTRRCVHYIRDRAAADEPFLLFYAMTSPHTPINPSQTWIGQSGVSPYADFLLETDWSVGQVLRALDQYGLSDDTLVIFTADNGTSPKCNFKTLKDGGVDLRGQWRGMKADIFEGGHRVPFLVRWPGVVPAGATCDECVCLSDIMATVAAALRVPVPADAAEDSESLLGQLRGECDQRDRAIVHHSSRGRFAIRSGCWKLICCAGSGGWTPPAGDDQARAQGLPSLQLYDLDADPSEQVNLVDVHGDRVALMLSLLKTQIEGAANDTGDWWSALPWPRPTSP
ncbi:MAG: arylsulfatase [Phycisphaerales bacterium]|nr:arylsulfatase [Phycisphaerales bacterium]